MNPRRLALAAAAAATLAAVTSGVAVPAATAAKPRPNIVLIQTDDQTAASMRYMPWVRRLIGRAGTTFSRSFVSLPQCCPSRATLLTGQYAHNHRVLQNKAPRGGYKRLDKSNWLPVWLQRAGYHTIQLRRTLNGYGTDEQTRTEIQYRWHEREARLDLRDRAPCNAYDYV